MRDLRKSVADHRLAFDLVLQDLGAGEQFSGSGMPQCAVIGWPGHTGQTSPAALSQTVMTKSICGASGLANTSHALLDNPQANRCEEGEHEPGLHRRIERESHADRMQGCHQQCRHESANDRRGNRIPLQELDVFDQATADDKHKGSDR
jgi:hypothetical protein